MSNGARDWEKGAVKNDSEKGSRPELVPPQWTLGVGSVLAFGANKYSAGNWMGGMDWSRLIGAAQRHILAWQGGEDLDPETGLGHLYHAGCCLAFLSEYQRTGEIGDDRDRIQFSSTEVKET